MSRIARAVTMIPPSIHRFAPTPTGLPAKKRVAAYARVSTDNEEQLTSYEAQVDHYTKHIKANADWRFIEVYADEGISATSTKKRDGFKRMIADALAGKIDLIITKSVSRFARNTVDTLTTVRQLKEKGVEVYFEKENIYTLDSKGELLITIMSSLAQEESRSISENVTWGQRKRFADGKVSLPYGQFLGYEKGANGLPKIVEKEAAIVRRIYKLFLEGKAPSTIAKLLTAEGILSPAGRERWQGSTVLSILSNEKYKGDALLQKGYTADFLTKKRKINNGEIPQYYVENSHPAIIQPEVFDIVQHEIARRKAGGRYTYSAGVFSSRIICPGCGGYFGIKQWHTGTKYERLVWQCTKKYQNRRVCPSPHYDEEALKRAFLGAFNSLVENKDELIAGYKVIIKALTDTTALDKESAKLQSECEVVLELVRKCVEENAATAIDQRQYERKYNDLAARYDKAKSKLEELGTQQQERRIKRQQIESFLVKLKASDTLVTEFDEALFYSTIDHIMSRSKTELTFVFKDGTEVRWTL